MRVLFSLQNGKLCDLEGDDKLVIKLLNKYKFKPEKD
jgi:hypothetical protein